MEKKLTWKGDTVTGSFDANNGAHSTWDQYAIKREMLYKPKIIKQSTNCTY